MRKVIEAVELSMATTDVFTRLHEVVDEKGSGAFASSHETLGVLIEEMVEYLGAVHANAPVEAKIKELQDIAVAAIFGIASFQVGGCDW